MIFPLLLLLLFLPAKPEEVTISSAKFNPCQSTCCSFAKCFTQAMNSSFQNLTIFLDGNDFFVFENEFSTFSAMSVPDNYTRVIMPLPCQGTPDSCLVKSVIHLKTEKFFFFDIRGYLSFRNIRVQARDLHIPSNSNASCYRTLNGCCPDETCYVDTQDPLCFLKEQALVARLNRSILLPMFALNNNSLGGASNLSLINFELTYFYATKSPGYCTMIMIDFYAANVYIFNSTFTRFYFLEGMLTISVARLKNKAKSGNLSLVFANSSISYYNDLDFNEKVMPNYGSSYRIAYLFAVLFSSTVNFSSTEIMNMKYRLFLIQSSSVSFTRTNFRNITMKFDGNEVMYINDSPTLIDQATFSLINTTSKLLIVYTSSLKIINSTFFSSLFFTTGAFDIHQNNNFTLDSSKLKDITLNNSAYLFYFSQKNQVLFSSNQYINIINPLTIFDSSWNTFRSTSEFYYSLWTKWPEGFIFNVIGTNNSLTFEGTSFLTLSLTTGGSVLGVSSYNNLSFSNFSVNDLTSPVKSGFMSVGNANNIQIRLSSFRVITSGLSAIATCNDFNNIELSDSEFSAITVVGNGGLFSGNQFSRIVMKGCSLGNVASGLKGGALFFNASNTISIYSSLFSKVSARDFGGVFALDLLNNLTINNSVFRTCTVGSPSSGGVFSLNTQNIFVLNFSFFEWSEARTGGIGIFRTSNVIEIFGSEFAFNAANNGGCFYLGTSNILRLRFSIFLNSSADDLGGAVMADNDNMIMVIQTRFTRSSSQIAGVFYLNSLNNLEINNSVLNVSFSKDRGGCFYMNNDNILSLLNTVISGSSSLGESGCIYSYVLNQVFIYDVAFQQIYAKLRGGAVLLYFNSNLTIARVNFSDSNADLRGGCFYLCNENILKAQDLIIEDSSERRNFKFIIFFLNDNVFIIRDLTILKANLGFFVSHFNKGEIDNLKIEPREVTVASANLDSYTVLDGQNNLYSIYEEEISIMCYSSDVTIKNLDYSGLPYQLLSSLNSLITLRDLTVRSNELSRRETYLFTLSSSMLDAMNLTFWKNSANLLFLNNSNATFFDTIIVYDQVWLRIINFVNSFVEFRGGVVKYDVSLTQIEGFNQDFEKLAYDSLVFQSSTVKITRMRFLCNFGANGGALQFLDSKVLILRSMFAMNTANQRGGAIYFQVGGNGVVRNFHYTLDLRKCVFVKNRAIEGGGVSTMKYEALNFTTTMNFSRGRFSCNEANRGGVLHLLDFDVLRMQDMGFKFNRAIGKNLNQDRPLEGIGGVMFISSESEVAWSFSNLKFLNNSADLGGAIFYETQILTVPETSCLFQGNKARKYGPDKASVTSRIAFSSIYEKFLNKAWVRDLQSGRKYECSVSISGYDFFDQLVKTNAVKFNIATTMKLDYVIKQDNKTVSQGIAYGNQILGFTQKPEGLYCNPDLVVASPLNASQFFFNISFNSIYAKVSPSLPLRLFIGFRPCQMGEYAKDHQCVTCPVGYYLLSFDENATECQKCKDSDRFYCFGGSNLTPKPKYWRLDYFSENFMECPNPSSCLGYNFSSPEMYTPLLAIGECAPGYHGVLCGECIENFGLMDKFFCAKCDNEYIYFYVIFSVIFKVVIIMFSVHKAMIMCLSLITSNIVNLRKVISSILMKILFNHLQCLIIVFSIPSLIMPDIIKNIFHFSKATSPNVTEVLSLECFMKNLKMSMNPQTMKLVIIWVSPISLIIISSVYLAIYLRNKKKKYVIKNIMDRLRMWFAIFITVLMIVFPDCMKICFETFNCLMVGYRSKPQYRLAVDFSVKCWEGSHWRLIYGLALPFLIIFGFGFPVLIMFKLISHWRTNSLNNKTELLKYGYFYFGYDKQFFFWDLVILARKIGIILIDVFFLTSFNNDLITQPVLAIFLVLFVSLYFQLVYQPYRKDKLDLINSLENKSLIALVGTVYVGLLNIEFVFEDKDVSGLLLFIFVFLINLNFGVFWFMAFVKYIVSDKLHKWKLALMSCFISSYTFIKQHFHRATAGSGGISKERWAVLDKYTIELKKKSRKARQNPMQESLIEQIRKSSLKNLKKRKSTICIRQPDRFKCGNCEMTLKIEEENKKLRDQLFLLRENLENKDSYLKELQSKLSQMKTMIRSNRNLDLDKEIKSLRSELSASPKSASSEIEKTDSEILGEKLKNLFQMVKCLHQKEKLLTKENYEISARIFLYTSKDIRKEFFLNYILYYDFELEISDMLINYDYDREKIQLIFLEKKETKSVDFFLTVEHSLLINITDLNPEMESLSIIAQIIIGDSVDQNLEIPFGFDSLINVNTIPLPQLETCWNHETFLSLHSNDVGSDKIDMETVLKILENSVFFMNFKRRVVSENLEEHFAVISICEVASDFYPKIVIKNKSIMRIEIGTCTYETASVDLMEFIMRNLFKKLSLKKESFNDNI